MGRISVSIFCFYWKIEMTSVSNYRALLQSGSGNIYNVIFLAYKYTNINKSLSTNIIYLPYQEERKENNITIIAIIVMQIIRYFGEQPKKMHYF